MEHASRSRALHRAHYRFTPAERSTIVDDFARSGLTQAEFAKKAGISAWTLSRWMSEAGDQRTTGDGRSSRVQVQIFNPAAESRGVFELTFDSKLSLRVPAGFDETELRRLVAILREAC
jgi:transposase-like protein